MVVREAMIGLYPCLIARSSVPLVVLAGLSPDAGVGRGPMRRTHEQARRPWTSGRRVFCLNRRVGLPLGLTMPMLAAEHVEAMRAEFGEPVDVLGLSTGGSIAQQLAADHPDVVRRLVLISTGCRLGPAARMAHRRVAARIRAGAARQALAVMAAEFVPRWRGRYIAAVVASVLGTRWFPADDLCDMATTNEAEDTSISLTIRQSPARRCCSPTAATGSRPGHPRGDRRERSAPSVSRLLAPVGPRVWRNSQRAGRRGERRGAASRSPAAAPSRASLLTGHYPSLHGVTQTDGLSKSADNPVYEARLRHLAPDVRSGNTRARLSGTRVRSLGHQLTNQRERGGVDQFHQTQLRLARGHGQHCMTSLCCPRAVERERDWPDRAPEGGRPPRDDVIVHLPPQRAR